MFVGSGFGVVVGVEFELNLHVKKIKLGLLNKPENVCESIRPYTTLINGSKPTIYDISNWVVYSKYTINDMSYMRLYATCCCFSQRNGRVAGL